MPKGVMHSFANIAATAKTMGEVFKFGPDERVLSYLPLAHVAERIGVEGNSLYHGFRVYFADSLDTFARDLQRARPTVRSEEHTSELQSPMRISYSDFGLK